MHNHNKERNRERNSTKQSTHRDKRIYGDRSGAEEDR